MYLFELYKLIALINENISYISKNNKKGNNSDSKRTNIFKITLIISSIYLMHI